MKKTKIKAIAAALLVSMSVSALAIPSYAKPIGDGLTIPENGVVTYDFNTSENPFEEHSTDGKVETAHGTPNTPLEIGGIKNYVFQIGKGERNIYTPKNWETDYTKKSMSVRINNSGLRHTGNMSFQRIILWYENETNWLGLDWKISDSKETERNDYTYDTKIVAMKSGLANSASATSETVLEKWADLKYNGKKMLVGDKADWLRLDVTYAAKDKIELSLYKENNPNEKYVNANITTKSFDAYDIKNATKVSDSSTYFADNDLRKGLFGIAGVNYDNNVGYYDDLTVTLDTDSAKILKFKTDNADALALTPENLYNTFKTNYVDYTAAIAKVKTAYTEYAALSDNAKAMLTSEITKLEDLLLVEKKADAYMGNEVNIDFESGLSADKYMTLLSDYTGGAGGQKQLGVIDNPSTNGNASSKALQLAQDGWSENNIMRQTFNLTDNNSTNLFNSVSYKSYLEENANSWHGLMFYYYYADQNNYKYIKVISEGGYYKLENGMRFEGYGNSATATTSEIIISRGDFYRMNGDTKEKFASTLPGWVTINLKYTKDGVLVSVTDCNGVTSIEQNVTKDFIDNGNIYKIRDDGNVRCYETKAIAESKGVPENYLKDADGNEIAGGINDGRTLVLGVNKFAKCSIIDDLNVTFRSPYTMTMTNGAWLRNDATPGIRFGTQDVANNELYSATDCTVVAAGALFMPYDKLEDGEQLTVERATVRNANGAKALKAESATSTVPKDIYGVLANVIENDKIDKNRDFVCRTYIKYTKAGDPEGVYRYVYADADNENMKRSLSKVVLAAAKDLAEYGGDIYDDAIAALKNKGYLGGNKQ